MQKKQIKNKKFSNYTRKKKTDKTFTFSYKKKSFSKHNNKKKKKIIIIKYNYLCKNKKRGIFLKKPKYNEVVYPFFLNMKLINEYFKKQ